MSTRLSLVMGTLGRGQEIDRFLQSLLRQEASASVELILVDQNDDDRIDRVLRPYQERLAIKHVKASPGLSHARNVGLRHATGDLVAFPDDDCWYPEGVVKHVLRFFDRHPDWDGLTGRSLDGKGQPSAGRWDETSGPINKRNVWRRAISYTIFLRREVVQTVGAFDEHLGVGAGTPLGSGEETDYLLRALQERFQVWYDPSLTVHHPSKTHDYDAEAIRRAYAYGTGMGYLIRKYAYTPGFLLYYALRACGGIAWGVATLQPMAVRFYVATLAGRLRGYFEPEDALRRTENEEDPLAVEN